ncbi:hypothetical protein BXZ70DRAFT_700062 [Cristinia sonorae]|uniref:Meiotically up-regulated protein Msb1/Mug8 domain-containing protein n=1 Tax=Cristinia sonorae TaxID=1940300 RepID=A0A8K0UD97_9AGAR|nr:hypothetical protein BXZ70DRAFT_700062 [Cristinia sonorae]
MPSFFSKVFGRKKDEKESSATHTRRHSASASLLEGKYEAVSPTSSPTADKFKNELGNKEKEKDGFSLFRPRSRSTAATTNPHPDTAKPPRLVPHLDLNLSVQQETKSRALDVVFEAADDRGNLPVAIIGERRLAPLETFLLVKACAAAIVNRGGLETLGVMHPHWYSASPEIQRRLISLFILSLAPTNTEATLSPTPDSATALFESELNYTRSPHDIAAVLRWALRHLRLEGSSFGSNSDGEDVWKWYTTYSEAERSANYPPTAFSQSLAPSIPGSHFQLLTVTLDIITSLAAHAESNGSSGSKLSKFLGLWLLTAQRALESDDWVAFYNRWERAGRILEHLFLSYIRDEAEKKKIALRLTDLVKQFPYTTGTDLPEDGLLSRPRFSTRLYDTLFVRVSTELPTDKSPKPKHHLLRLIAQSFKAEVIATGQYAELWEQIKKTASEEAEGDSPSLSRIFNDDTVRLLSLVPLDPDANKTITLAIPPTREPRGRRRSASLGGGKPNGTQPSAAHGKTLNGKTQPVVSPEPASVPLPASPTDWSDFSSAGFGETSLSKNLAFSLLGDDVEVTVPPHAQPKRRASKKGNAGSSPAASRRSSVDNPRPGIQRPPADVPTSTTPADEPKPAKTQTSFIDLIKLDEAFIDFWSDALTDPILTSNWPTFVLCQLKANLPFAAETPEGKPIQWLVIEHAFTYPPPPPPPPAPVPEPVSPTTSNTKRAASPRPSIQSNISSRKSSTFSARTRFSFFGTDKGSPTTTTPTGTPKTGFSFSQRKRSAKASRVGEMGEVLAEVEESPSKPAEGLGLVIGEEAKEPQASKEAPTATVTTSREG